MASKKHTPVNILQITDTHLYGVKGGSLLKLNTHDSLKTVLDTIKEKESEFELVLATGDIAQDGSEAAYQYFIKYMAELNTPFRWIPGNHDIPAVMQQVSSGNNFCDKQVRVGNWEILMLDSSRRNYVHGLLGKQEMKFLAGALKKAEDDPEVDHCMVCLHHNPFPGSSEWMKDIGLKNDTDFLELVSGSNVVRAILYGHIHQELDFEYKHIRCFCTPSTCIQFKPNVVDFALDSVNPGYRHLTLNPDGTITTRVIRATKYKMKADFQSAGY